MEKLTALFDQFPDLITSLMIFVAAIVVGILAKYVIFKLLDFYNRHRNPLLVRSLTQHLSGPMGLFIPLLFVSVSLPLMPLSPAHTEFLARLIEILDIITFAWMLIKLTDVARDMVRHKYAIDKADNYRERKLFTQLQFLRRLALVIIVFLAVAIILLSFEPVRKLGTGLLTSAGVAGIVIGFAAQRSIANLLAGLQLAFTQPIRLDDVLVVENEFGRVEEITLTYVVLRLWDNRRLILPLNYFIEKPFQNWTRTGSDILATVYLYTDYDVPVEALRQELARILEKTDLWDKRVQGLQVTDSKEGTLELRALMSASNSAIAWDLRCLVREKLVTFLQQQHPASLPKVRAELSGLPPSNFSKPF
ncbi:mechanosensitive ion channel family protein [Pontibacter liquoris]|uniref:mechanosensitive ion channel family protein n=1 Tax=Pontibacter liquoris TaxID=2905677 RepID=UPI001FA7CFAD|nr:mechanosensitive ion channel domain-containing protein [Pontibacter liquoris]